MVISRMQGSISHVSHPLLQDRLGSQFQFLGEKQPRVRADLEYTLGLEFFGGLALQGWKQDCSSL